MGMFVNSDGGGGRAGQRRKNMRPMAEINVTPMVDVMLVLLIIFMVAAPLLTVGVQVDLPKSQASSLPRDDKPLTVSVNAQGEIYVQEEKLDLENLGVRLSAMVDANPEALIYVRGDEAIDYGRVMEVMGAINRAGFVRVGLVSRSMDQ